MNYGYDSRCKGWQEARAGELARELAQACEGVAMNDGFAVTPPYVETDGMYFGVRVRRITHVKERDAFVRQCDLIYERVMLDRP